MTRTPQALAAELRRIAGTINDRLGAIQGRSMFDRSPAIKEVEELEEEVEELEEIAAALSQRTNVSEAMVRSVKHTIFEEDGINVPTLTLEKALRNANALAAGAATQAEPQEPTCNHGPGIAAAVHGCERPDAHACCLNPDVSSGSPATPPSVEIQGTAWRTRYRCITDGDILAHLKHPANAQIARTVRDSIAAELEAKWHPEALAAAPSEQREVKGD